MALGDIRRQREEHSMTRQPPDCMYQSKRYPALGPDVKTVSKKDFPLYTGVRKTWPPCRGSELICVCMVCISLTAADIATAL